MPVKSRKAHLEATHSSKQTDFEMEFEGNTKVLSTTKTLARAIISGANWLRSTAAQCTIRSRALSKGMSKEIRKCRRIQKRLLEQRFKALAGFEARPSNDFERPVAAQHARAVISSEKTTLGQRFRMLSNAKKPPRASISTARWLRGTPEH